MERTKAKLIPKKLKFFWNENESETKKDQLIFIKNQYTILLELTFYFVFSLFVAYSKFTTFSLVFIFFFPKNLVLVFQKPKFFWNGKERNRLCFGPFQKTSFFGISFAFWNATKRTELSVLFGKEMQTT